MEVEGVPPTLLFAGDATGRDGTRLCGTMVGTWEYGNRCWSSSLDCRREEEVCGPIISAICVIHHSAVVYRSRTRDRIEAGTRFAVRKSSKRRKTCQCKYQSILWEHAQHVWEEKGYPPRSHRLANTRLITPGHLFLKSSGGCYDSSLNRGRCCLGEC